MKKLHFKKIWLALLCLVALLVTLTACGESTEPVVSVIDGYLAVNGKKTEYQVKDNNHTFGSWTLYNEGETDCEKKLYYRTCPHCATIEWKEGSYQDHSWNTVTTKPTCQAGGYDTKTCKLCEKTEICNETPIASHEYKAEYDSDNTFHWKSCQHCTAVTAKGEHTLDASGSCSVCAALVGPTEGILYELSDDGTYALVMAYNGSATAVKIADQYQGVPVQVIYENAFKETAITSVIIPETVTAIGDYAFYDCSSLTSINIPASVTTIGDYAFRNCSSLTSINIPASVTTIGSAAFFGCSNLTSINIPASVTTIGEGAFRYCSNLTSINIPESVTSIGKAAFSGCDKLITEKNYCQYAKSGDNPYYVLIGVTLDTLSTYEIEEGTKIIANSVFSSCSRLTNINIPASVTTISDNAFTYCSSLKTVTFAENSQLTAIGLSAFNDCSGLTSINIPASVKAIGAGAFQDCSSLTSIHFGGTKAQWQAIEKGSSWNYSTGKYTIYCTDGNLSK